MSDIPNYLDRGLALLAAQFQQRLPDGSFTNFQKMIQIIAQQAQEINTQQQLLLNFRSLKTAYGTQLDGLGQILGLPRIPGQTDSDYREALEFQIFINGSHGTPEDLLAILKFLTDASMVWIIELYPAAYQMITNGLNIPVDGSELIETMQSVSPAGVEFVSLTATYNTNPFSFSSDPITTQFFVAPNPDDINQINPFQVDPGTGAGDFFVQAGETVNPNFGGGFAEALGTYPTYTIDTTGAGQLPEAIQI